MHLNRPGGSLMILSNLLVVLAASSLMDRLRQRKVRSVSQHFADWEGLQPVGSPSAIPSCDGELGGPSPAAAEAIGEEPALVQGWV